MSIIERAGESTSGTEGQVSASVRIDSSESPSTQLVRHEASLKIREYWAAKKREERARKRSVCPPPISDGSFSPECFRTVCKKMLKCWQDATHGMDPQTQKSIFSQLLQHRDFQMLHSSALQIEKSIFSNIQHTFNQVKVPHTGDELTLKRAACMMMLNSESGESNSIRHSQVAKFFGMHRRNFVAANLRLQQGNDGQLPLQLCHRQLPQTSTITSDIRVLVFEFWRTETRVSPNKKDVSRKRLGRKVYTKHPVHLLDEPQVELYKRFCREHSVKLSLRSFEGLKPYFVRKLKDRYTCCCIYHVQMTYLKEALNNMRQNKFGVHAACTCSCLICMSTGTMCKAVDHRYSSVTSLLESMLCPKPVDATFNMKACLTGQCNECGLHKLELCPKEAQTNAFHVMVKVFEEVGYAKNDEEAGTKTHKDVVTKQMGCKDFISFFKQHLKTFINHNYIARWQAQQFKDCLAKFPTDVVVSVIDFAENYTFKEQNEVQSMHWFNFQVTILVQITYVRTLSDKVEKFIHFWISDDKTHDTLFVQHCLCLHSKWLKEQGFTHLQRHWVWSDGCAAQFKAKRPLYFVSRYYQVAGLEMMWSFFASGHGKGEHDGAGAVIKRTLTHEQLKPNAWPMKCAADVVAFLKHTFCNADQQNSISRVFWEIKENEVSRSRKWNCQRLKGLRKMHCMSGYSPVDKCALRWKPLSCFCDFCMSQRWRRCLNRQHVEEWDYMTIQPLDTDSDSDEESNDEGAVMPMYGGHHDAISDALQVGDNFATNTSEEGWDFYILKCSKAKYKATKAQRDAWGNCVSAGSYVVEGYYYEKVDGEDDAYHIPAGKPCVMLPSHLIRSIKFQMGPSPQNINWFIMSSEVYESIYNSMPSEI